MRPQAVFRTICTVALLSAGGGAFAQYKWIAPDGSTNYADRPPSAVANATKLGEAAPDVADSGPSLPFALRAATQKYPVTMFTVADCKPCEQARAHLAKRGVPFTEVPVRSQTEVAQMTKAGFAEPSYPAVLVGRQRQLGFESAALDSLLDSAGYPKTSMLPAGYKPASGDNLAKADKSGAGSAHADARGAAGKAAARSNVQTADADSPRTTSKRGGNAPAAAVEPAAPTLPPPAPGTPPGLRF